MLVLIVIVGLCVGGYFAYKSMTSPSDYLPAKTQTIGDLHMVVSDPDTGTSNPANNPLVTTAANSSAAPTPTTPAPGANSSSDKTALIGNIKTLIQNKTTLKMGSKGTSVGYVQQFMNLYLKKTSKIDNVFGKTLQANVITFQKQNKISATGVVGTSTLQMMVVWLQKN